MLRSCLAIFQNFNFKKFVLNTGSLELYIFRIQRTLFNIILLLQHHKPNEIVEMIVCHYIVYTKAWFPPRRSHLSSWATKFDCLRFIAQSSSPEHSHQLRIFSPKLLAFYKMIFFQV